MKRGDKVYFIKKGVVMSGEISCQKDNNVEVYVKKRYRKIYKLRKCELAKQIEV